METRWTQGGLRPRVVHESTSDWIRRVAFDWPNAVMGTAAGSVLVCNCEELGGLEYRERRAACWRGVKTRTRGIGARSRTADSASVPPRPLRRGRGHRRRHRRDLIASGAAAAYARGESHPARTSTTRRTRATARRCARWVPRHPDVVTGAEFASPADACGRRASTGRSVDGGSRQRTTQRTTRTMMRRTRDWSSSGNGPRVRRRCASPWTPTRGFCTPAPRTERRRVGRRVFGHSCGHSGHSRVVRTIGATLGAWTAHEDGVTRSVSHARGGCLTGAARGRCTRGASRETASAAR